jgi:hypothetical protein
MDAQGTNAVALSSGTGHRWLECSRALPLSARSGREKAQPASTADLIAVKSIYLKFSEFVEYWRNMWEICTNQWCW